MELDNKYIGKKIITTRVNDGLPIGCIGKIVSSDRNGISYGVDFSINPKPIDVVLHNLGKKLPSNTGYYIFPENMELLNEIQDNKIILLL